VFFIGVTIHNAGQGYHQEIGDLPFAKTITGLPWRVVNENLLDGNFDPFLAASYYAVLNTVSENYARELRETYDDELTGWLGHRLLARGVRLNGVTNGIDPDDFDLNTPEQLGLPVAKKNAGKDFFKKDLLSDIKEKKIKTIKQDGTLKFSKKTPLFTFIGRFTAQKGVDKMIGALKKMLPIDPDFQILILGSGEKGIEESLVKMASSPKYAGRICVLRGYDPILANRIYAAGDFFLIPSRYEPCGLTDYIAQLFGNLPIVHHVGGLVKVVDGETGFAYHDHDEKALAGAMVRAIHTYRGTKQNIAAMQNAARVLINQKYTWDKVMKRYLDLYHQSKEFN